MSGLWMPDKRFEGQNVIVVGGGPSLRGFDWERLRDLPTIGCNEAFRYGVDIIKVTLFVDSRWFLRRCPLLAEYQGLVVTQSVGLRRHNLPWLKVMKRYSEGLHLDGLGFGTNSGCSAINLALLMGAARVYLIGFDCKVSEDGKFNYHNHYEGYLPKRPRHVTPYPRFIRGMEEIAKDLPRVFPGRKIINLTPDSALTVFPIGDIDEIIPVTAGCAK